MNRSRWLLLSLALNALLLLAVAWRWRPLLVPPPRVGAATAVIANGIRADQPAGAATDPVVDTTPPVTAFHWSQLDLADWPAYRDGLRRTGCPERTVREIIEPLVRRHFGQQMRALTAPSVSRFWELMATGGQAGRKSLETAMEALAEQQREALKSLFGSSTAPDEAPATGAEDGRLAFLPAAVREQVVAARVRHQERMRQAARESENDATARNAANQASQKALDQELATLMSPDELAEFRRRHSQFAGLRELEGVELSEAELAEIIRLKESKQTSPAAEAKELETLLGPERAADFVLAQQPGYQELLRLTERLDVAPEKARELWSAKQLFEREAQSVAKDTPHEQTERAAHLLTVLREATRARAGEVLGERGQAAWERQQAGWLKQSFELPEEDPLAGAP